MVLVNERQSEDVGTKASPDVSAESVIPAGLGEPRVSDEELTAIVMATIYGWGGTARLDESNRPAGATRAKPMGCRLRASMAVFQPRYSR
jgi:hypothetical protein